MPLPSRSTHNGVLPPRQNSPNSTYSVNITVLAPPTQGNITYTTNLTHAYNESDLTSIDVPLTETVVVGGPSASATTTVVFHIGNSTSDSGSGMNLQPAIPALGAVLGVVIVISVILVGLLLRKNKQLFRAAKEARESALSDPSESNYPLASKELDVVSQEDSPAQLKRQLAEVPTGTRCRHGPHSVDDPRPVRLRQGSDLAERQHPPALYAYQSCPTRCPGRGAPNQDLRRTLVRRLCQV